MTRRTPPTDLHATRTRKGATTRSNALLGVLVIGLMGTGSLAACSSGADDAAGQGQASASAPATSAGASPSPAATDDDASDDTSSPAAGDDSTPSASPSSDGAAQVSRCTADHLTGSLSEGDGGAAGSTLPYIVLENTGTDPCRLQGWPGVSLVGGGDGTQIGAAATMDRTSPHATVTLKPNGHAHAPLRVTDARNYPKSKCDPQAADGLRVYVPGETESIFVEASGLTGCANDDVELLEVQAIQPGVG